MLLEKELSEKNVYENIIEFGVNKANGIITNYIYTDHLSEKCMRKKYYTNKKKKKFKSPWTDSEFLALRKNVNFWSRKIKLFPFDQNVLCNLLPLSFKSH